MRILMSNNKALQSGGKVMMNPTEIIKDSSLLYWYDPSRPESYPGSGTNVYDLSGRGVNATISGSPVFTGNSFTCNSGDTLSATLNLPLTGPVYGATYDITITLWFKMSTTARYQYPWMLNNGGGNLYFDINDTDSGYHYQTMWVYWNSGGSPLSALPLGALGGTNSYSDFITGSWWSYTFRRNVSASPYTEHFVNGVKIGTIERLGDQTGELFYGGRLVLGNASLFIGDIGSSHAYGRALSDAEIIANYNVEKNRFR